MLIAILVLIAAVSIWLEQRFLWAAKVSACVLCLLYTYGTACLALIRDIKKPKLDWITEQQAVKSNYGVLISMLGSWGILVALAIASYFLLSAGLGMFEYFAVIAAVLAVWCLLMRNWMKKTAEKYYCQG